MKDQLSLKEFNKVFSMLNKEERFVIIDMLEELEELNKLKLMREINKYNNKLKGCSI